MFITGPKNLCCIMNIINLESILWHSLCCMLSIKYVYTKKKEILRFQCSLDELLSLFLSTHL